MYIEVFGYLLILRIDLGLQTQIGSTVFFMPRNDRVRYLGYRFSYRSSVPSRSCNILSSLRDRSFESELPTFSEFLKKHRQSQPKPTATISYFRKIFGKSSFGDSICQSNVTELFREHHHSCMKKDFRTGGIPEWLTLPLAESLGFRFWGCPATSRRVLMVSFHLRK